MDFNESQTKEILARAFAGLCQDGARYQFIAKSASQEGFEYIADRLKQIAKNKMAHASVIYKLMLENIQKTVENISIEAGYPFEAFRIKTSLQDSAEIEEYEGKNIYPHFAKIAHDEGFKNIESIFNLISEVNLENAKFLKQIGKKFDEKALYKSSKDCEWVCSNCGHHEKKKSAWTNCPLCSYPQGYVIIPLDE